MRQQKVRSRARATGPQGDGGAKTTTDGTRHVILKAWAARATGKGAELSS